MILSDVIGYEIPRILADKQVYCIQNLAVVPLHSYSSIFFIAFNTNWSKEPVLFRNQMAGVFSCGFARVAVKESFLAVKTKDKAGKYDYYISYFEDDYKENFAVTKKAFYKKSAVLTNIFNQWIKTEDKQKYIQHFSKEAWNKLSLIQKLAHTATNCKACHVYHQSFQNTFPLKCHRLTKPTLVDVATKALPKLKPTKSAAKDTLVDWYNKCNDAFKEVYDMNIADGLTKLPHLNITHKKSASELKRVRRQNNMKQKSTIEQHWESMDADTLLGTRQSFSQRDQQRKALFFESPKEATKRSRKRKAQEEAGERVPKRHSPDPLAVDFDKEGLLEEVNNKEDGQMVCICIE